MAIPPTESLNKFAQHVGQMFHIPVAIDSSPGQKKWAEGCSTFIKNDGTYGPTGVMLLEELTAAKRPALFSNDIRDFQAICPNWVHMQESERQAFLIYAFAALANQESSCNPKSNTPKGEAGFLSLPFKYHPTVHVVCNSDPKTGLPNRHWRPLDGKDNLMCGIKFIESQLVGISPAQRRRVPKGLPVSNTFFAVGSHFGPLRPFVNSGHGGAEKVRRRLSEYTPCGTDYRTMSAQLDGGRAYIRGFKTPVATPASQLARSPTVPHNGLPAVPPVKIAERAAATAATN